MYRLSRILNFYEDHSSLTLGVAYILAPLIIVFIAIYFYNEKRLKKRELISNGFGWKNLKNSKQRVKVRLNSRMLIFNLYNPKLSLQDFTSRKSWLEGVYMMQFENPKQKKRIFRQNRIYFIVENFKTHENYVIKNRERSRLFCGIENSGSEKFKDTKIYNVALFRGPQGSGKTTSIGQTVSHFKTCNPDYKIVYVDTKSQELQYLADEVFKLDDEDSYKALDSYLKSILHHFSDTNSEKNKRWLIILDEASDYLGNDLEVDKEIADLKKSITSNTVKIIRKLRSYGIVVIIGTQDISATSIRIPPSLLTTTFTSKVATRQQVISLGLSQDSMDEDLKNSRWIIDSSKKVQFPNSLKQKVKNEK